MIRIWLLLFRELYEPFLLLTTIEVSEYGSSQLPLTKDCTIEFVLKKALEEIHIIHIETLTCFQDVPEIERDENKSYHTQMQRKNQKMP